MAWGYEGGVGAREHWDCSPAAFVCKDIFIFLVYNNKNNASLTHWKAGGLLGSRHPSLLVLMLFSWLGPSSVVSGAEKWSRNGLSNIVWPIC